MKRTSCSGNAGTNSADTLDTVTMNVFRNQIETNRCECRNAEDVIAILCRQNELLEKILATLRACCGSPPHETCPVYTTGPFSVNENGTLTLAVRNSGNCPQEGIASVYGVTGQQRTLLQRENFTVDKCDTETRTFDRVFSAGQTIELCVQSCEVSLAARLVSVSGTVLRVFNKCDFDRIDLPS